MIKSMIGLVIVLSLALHPDALAQPPTPPLPPPPGFATHTVPLRVQVILSTYQGEKKISSVPYTLSVNAASSPVPGMPGFPSQLRMGVKVPVPAMAPPTVDGKRVDGMMMAGPVIYQDIGTNIDCSASALDDGRFQLHISIEDQSFANPTSTSRPGEPPVIRSFRLSNQVVLRDGQSTQFTAATDRVSGETVRAEVTMTVVK
jgi:hypothetical protein